MSSGWFARLKKLDYNTKTKSEVEKRTSLGGLFAIVVVCVMAVLFVWEVGEFLVPRTKDTLSVDIVRMELMEISFDITFHRLPCEDVTIDLLDDSGAHFTAIGHNVVKKSLTKDGVVMRTLTQDKLSEAGHSVLHQPGYCHDCLKELPDEAREDFLKLKKMGVAPECCNSCPVLMIVYQLLKLDSARALVKTPCVAGLLESQRDVLPHEVGCRTMGSIKVHKIGGNFHVAAGRSGTQSHGSHTHHMHRVNYESLRFFNISHTIHRLHFGEHFYGKVDPLNNVEVWEPELAQYTYFVNVVPTVVVSARGTETPSHQYSYTVHREVVDLAARSFKLPGMFVKYNFDALRMTKRAHPHSSFSHFLTRVCALLGGSYVVFGLLYRGVAAGIDLAKKND